MTITRRSLADTYDHHDTIINAAQEAKRDATQAYRKQIDAQGMDKDSIKAEVEGFKVAYRRKVAITKKGVDEVEHRDAIADEIFLEITAARAPRATRVENIDEIDAETGEIMEPNSTAPTPPGVAADAEEQALSSNAGSSAPIQPETANETVVRNNVAQPPQANTLVPDGGAESTGNVGGSAGRLHSLGNLPTESPASVPVDTISETLMGTAGESPAMAAEPATVEGAHNPTSAVVAFARQAKPFRPDCLRPGPTCAGQGHEHCHACKKAKAAALPITTGGTEIEHAGRIG